MRRSPVLISLVVLAVCIICSIIMVSAANDLERDFAKYQAKCIAKYPQTYRLVNGAPRLRTDSGILPADPCNVLRSYSR